MSRTEAHPGEQVARGAGARAVLSCREADAHRDSSAGRGVISTPNVVVVALIRFIEEPDHLVARHLNFRPIPVQRFCANNDFFQLFHG